MHEWGIEQHALRETEDWSSLWRRRWGQANEPVAATGVRGTSEVSWWGRNEPDAGTGMSKSEVSCGQSNEPAVATEMSCGQANESAAATGVRVRSEMSVT